MLDNLDNITLIESVSADNIGDLSSKYDALLPFYSVRTNNVLSSLQEKYASKSAFLSDFIRMSSKEFAGLKNCGRKTVKEIYPAPHRNYDSAQHTFGRDKHGQHGNGGL